MQIVPLQPVYSQTMSIILGGQTCYINVYQKFYAMFFDLYVGGTAPANLIIGGVIVQNLNRMVRDAYLGFIGDFVFCDTQGDDSPTWDGLGSRYVLYYLEAADQEQIKAA